MEQGQAETQPMTPAEAIAALSSGIQEAYEKAEKPRDDQGKFVSKEAPKEPSAEPEATQEEPKEAPEEPKEEATETQTEEVPAQPKWKLKLQYKGEEREVEEEEARELAQKGYDYTQKTQAIAKEKAELEAKAKAEIEQARTSYLQQLEIQKQAVLKFAGVKSMAEIEALSKTDPAAAQQEFLRMVNVNQTVQALEAEQSKITQQKQSEMQEAMRKQASDAVEQLQSRINGWNNDLYGKILRAAVDNHGFKQAEVNAITDPRAIEVLHDAMKWREYQAAKPKTVEKRVAAVPKVQKPGTAAEKSDPKSKRLQDSKARFEKESTRDNAVAHLRELIEQGRL